MKRYLISLIFFIGLNSLFAQQGLPLADTMLIIRDVVISGNKITKENIILRELVFTRGDTLRKMELIPGIQKSKENLKNLSLFNFVNLDVDHFPENRIDLKIDVQERWYIWPTPIFEHGERNLSTFLKDPHWNKLNYGMWLKWNNFRGRNEFLNAKIRLGYKEQYVLQYEKPNLGPGENHKIFLSYSLSRQHNVKYQTRDNKPVYFKDEDKYAYNSADAFFAYSYRPALYSRHRIRFHFVDNWISDTVALLNPDYFGNGYTRYKHFKIDYVYRYDIRDSKVYPLEGQAYKLKVERTGLGIIKDYPFGNWEVEGTLFYHTKLLNRLYFAEVFNGRVSSNKDLPLVQQKALGYVFNLIGYEDYVIDGTDNFVNKLILKYQVIKPTSFSVPYIKAKQFSKVHFAMYLNLFLDAGYVNYKNEVHPSNFMVNEFQYSAGLGLDFVTYYDKVFGVGYAINRYGMRGFFFYVNTPFYEW